MNGGNYGRLRQQVEDDSASRRRRDTAAAKETRPCTTLRVTQSNSAFTPTAPDLIQLHSTCGNQAIDRLLTRRTKAEEGSEEFGDLAKTSGNDGRLVGQVSAVEKIQEGGEELEDLQKEKSTVQCGRRILVDIDRGTAPSISGSATEDVRLAKAAVGLVGRAKASNTLGAAQYGLTFPESVTAAISAKRDGTGNWVPMVIRLVGHFSQQVRLLPGQTEVTGPGGNTTKSNFCDQVTGLTTLGNTVGTKWYMRAAVQAHENVHLTRFKPALAAVSVAIATNIETTVSTPDTGKMTTTKAVANLKADPAFAASLAAAQSTWLTEILTRVAGDHKSGGPTDTAEHRIVDPMVKWICSTAKGKKWPSCGSCP